MGLKKDWQALDHQVDQAVAAAQPERDRPFLPAIDLSISIPEPINSMPISEVGKELSRLKTQFIKSDGTLKLCGFDPKHQSKLERLTHLWVRWKNTNFEEIEPLPPR